MYDQLLKLWCRGQTVMLRLRADQHGATAVEYAIMASMIAAVVVAVVRVIGEKTGNNFNTVNTQFP